MEGTSVEAGRHGESGPDDLIAGRYELGGVLGRGGMAVVHAGVDHRLGRPVAIKLLLPEMAARADIRTRFEAEARAAAQLSHPNVVAVFDTGDHHGTAYMVMERLPGETLADRFAAGPVDPEWLRQRAGEVLAALDAAHAAGIVHRDVKPGNVLLTAEGRAKVADFGIAKSAVATGGADLTTTGQLLGTPAYVAPERLEGTPATPASDLYSLGVMLYEGLAGRRPFDGDTPLGVAHAVGRGDHVPLGQLRPDLDPLLVAAVEQAMDLDPTRRFASVPAMARALGVDSPPTPVPAAAPTVEMGAAGAGAAGAGAAAAEPATVALSADRPAEGRPALHLLRSLWPIAAAALVTLAVLALVLSVAGGRERAPSPPPSTSVVPAAPTQLPDQAPPTTVAIRPAPPVTALRSPAPTPDEPVSERRERRKRDKGGGKNDD